MVPNFDLWPQQWQNSLHTARKSYSTPGEFYPNIYLETGPSTAFYKGICTAEEMMQELEAE